jgi:hypothetical protein
MTSIFRAPARTSLLAVLVFASLIAAGCGEEPIDETKRGGDTEVKLSKSLISADGAFEMKVPESWEQQNNLNDVAVLQAADREKEAYALLIADPRKPFEGTNLGKFADGQVQKFLESVTEPKLSGPELVIIDGDEALQYEIEGMAEDVGVVYLYTFSESPDRFLKAVTWSLAENYDDNKEVLAAVTESIKQLKAVEEPTPSPGATDSPSPSATLSPTSPSATPSPEPSPEPTPSIVR